MKRYHCFIPSNIPALPEKSYTFDEILNFA
jgi:hypothetical protein